MSCSCAAGPALEGMNISSGMRAADGAIEEVHFDNEKGFILEAIGDKTPVGLCGSGILAAIRELLKHNFITARGNIVKPEDLEVGDPRLSYLARAFDYLELSVTKGYERLFVECSQFNVK